jgi:hypothetical protein
MKKSGVCYTWQTPLFAFYGQGCISPDYLAHASRSLESSKSLNPVNPIAEDILNERSRISFERFSVKGKANDSYRSNDCIALGWRPVGSRKQSSGRSRNTGSSAARTEEHVGKRRAHGGGNSLGIGFAAMG